MSAIALVMEKRLPVRLMAKLDNYLEWKNERLRRDSIFSAISGALFLFLSIYHLATEGLSFTVIFTFICAMALFFWAIWYYLVYQRSLSVNKRPHEMAGDSKPKDVAAGNVLGLSQPGSITESTTRRLDATGPDKND